jgi:hypothetical protein
VDPRDEAVRSMSTPELIRHAVEEAKLFARAEILHAKHELQEEVRAAKKSGILMGAAAVAALCGLSVLLVALALALPLADALAALIVGGILVVAGALCGALGYRALPRKPLPKTAERLKIDLTMAKEQLA